MVTALFVVALAAIAASAMMTSAFIGLHRTSNLLHSEQILWYVQGFESKVCTEMARSFAAMHHNYTSLDDVWAEEQSLPLEGGRIFGHMEDLQGRFNLNNLGALDPKPYLDQFRLLLSQIPGIDRSAIYTLGPAIRDWIDIDNETYGPEGAEDQYYTAQLPVPYRTANILLHSPSEILAVKGMTPQIYAALHPWIAALPTTNSKINVNTAPAEVLLALTGDAGAGALRAFLDSRTYDPLTTQSNIAGRNVFPAGSAALQYVTVRSEFFQLQATVQVSDLSRNVFVTIHWPESNAPQIVAQTFDTD